MSVSRAPLFKAALVTALKTILPADTLVSYGHPGALSANDIVAVMNVSSAQDVATMSTNRSREETLTADVLISSWRGGPDQQAVTEQAYTLLGLLETYLQDSGTVASLQITLGGIVREARVTSHELAETSDPDDLALGRIAEISAVVIAHVRI
jgi:hypothetical protein